MSGTYPRETLADAASKATSLVDLMRRVGAPMGSKPRRYLRDRLAHYGIDTSHFQDEPLPDRPKRSYAKEILAEAAARSTNIREMFLHMGIPPEDGPYEHVKRRLDMFGIDTRHFVPPRAPADSKLFPEAEFTQAVAASHGLADLMRRLGLPAFSSSARAKARRSIDEYGLSVEHFTGQAHSAGVPSPRRRSAQDILVLRPAGTRRTNTPLLRRALDEIGVPRACVDCGQGELWEGKRLVLEVDHVNGATHDDRLENLRYLCPNCHASTRTWCRGRGRAPEGSNIPVH
ncbi:HNH endonuclease signature motif containing protein [Streptomyces sp. NPDC001904]|uniref:HNH endonuclease signature motif containing protein n=1 Tax=Streptomyces sp. NPDC001904 TaxID=3154531 RepID=UPI00331D20F3